MSDSKHGGKRPGYEYWGRRPFSGVSPSKSNKKITHGMERAQQGEDMREQIEQYQKDLVMKQQDTQYTHKVSSVFLNRKIETWGEVIEALKKESREVLDQKLITVDGYALVQQILVDAERLYKGIDKEEYE